MRTTRFIILTIFLALFLVVPVLAAYQTTIYAVYDRQVSNGTTNVASLSFANMQGGIGRYAHTATATTALVGMLSNNSLSDRYVRFNRTMFTFNTSVIGVTANIINATFGVRGTAKSNALGAAGIGITNATPADTRSYVAADYNKFSNFRLALDKTYAEWSITGYNNYTLNDTGINYVMSHRSPASTTASDSVFMLRTHWDIDNTFNGTWLSARGTNFTFRTVDFGTTSRPFLLIWYDLPPAAGFTKNVSSGLYPLAVQFNDTSTNAPNWWNWSLGDGTWYNTSTPTARNTSKLYSTGGNYTIRLYVNNTAGSSTYTNYVDIRNHTWTGFTANKTSGGRPLTVQFNVTVANDNATMWNWSLGGGAWYNTTTAALKNASYTYTNFGTYTVSETASSPYDTNTTTRTNYITVGEQLTAAFTSDKTSGVAPLTIQFTDTSSGLGISSWKWDFDNNGVTDSTAQNPLHTYYTPGIYTVSLNVTNASGSDTTTRTDYIWVDFASVVMFRNYRNHTGIYDTGGIEPTNILKWTFPTGNYVRSSMAVKDDIVYFGSYDWNISALYANTGTKKWNFTTGGAIPSAPAVADGVVYAGSVDNKLYAIYADNGTKKWDFTTGNYVYSSPALANGFVYVGSWDNKLYAIYADNGTKKWDYTTGDYVYSSPAVVDGIVYFGSYDYNVYAVYANNGTKKWNFTTGYWVASSPAVVDGIVYVGGCDDRMYALYADNGTQKWNFTTGTNYAIRSSPAVADGVVYFGSYNKDFYALFANNGTKKWNFTTGNQMQSSPAVADGIVYFGNFDSKLYALFTGNGTQKWNFTTGNWVDSSPVVADGVVYVGSDDHTLYALGGTPSPKADFFTNVTLGTAPLPVQFTDTSTGPGILSWKWNFTTGGTVVDSTSQDPVYTYVIPGTYTVNLTVTNSSGSGIVIKPNYITVETPSIDVSVTGTIHDWIFSTGTNEDTTSVDLTIDTNMNQWSVNAKDALDDSKPAGTEGNMTEWSGSSYVPSGKVLSNAVQVKYGSESYIKLSGTGQVIKSGTSPGNYQGDMGIKQEIAPTDPALDTGHQYRIVVTFTGSAA
jgi:eukaryotic-like serine/threonine-protein kinase